VSCSFCLSCRPFRLLFFTHSPYNTFFDRPSSRSTYLTIQYYGYCFPWSLLASRTGLSQHLFPQFKPPRFSLRASLFPVPYPATTTIRTTYQTSIKSPSNHTHGKPGIEPFLPLLLSTPWQSCESGFVSLSPSRRFVAAGHADSTWLLPTTSPTLSSPTAIVRPQIHH